MKLKSRILLDFKAIAEESGLRTGKVCHSPSFGWGVQNTNGVEGPDFGCITPPETVEGEELKIEDNHWCIYSKE